MRAAREDYEAGGSAAALSRAVAEADVLSSSATRLARAVAEAPRAVQDAPPEPPPPIDIEAINRWLTALLEFAMAPRCPACGGCTTP